MKDCLRIILLLCGVLPMMCGCSGDEGASAVTGYDVVLVTSVGGCGDNGYNDLILSGVLDFYTRREEEVRLSLRNPSGFEEVKEILDSWLCEDSGDSQIPSLLILASGDYKRIVEECSPRLSGNRKILLFECGHDNMPDNVSTFRIRRYGASWLAGAMAAESPEAHIIVPRPDDPLLKDAVDGFADGFMACGGKKPAVHCLAEDVTGFSKPMDAYNMVRNLEEVFIYPLAGGSNSGIFRYTRENPFSLQLISGMDTDCSDFSTRVPFSVEVHIDFIVKNMLENWIITGDMPDHQDFDLREGYGIDVKVNPYFHQRAYIFLDYYIDDDYWQKRFDAETDLAKRMEGEYYGR